MKAREGHDITVGGSNLGVQAIRAGLVNEYRLFVVPVVVRGGNQALPDDVLLKLELAGEPVLTMARSTCTTSTGNEEAVTRSCGSGMARRRSARGILGGTPAVLDPALVLLPLFAAASSTEGTARVNAIEAGRGDARRARAVNGA